MTVQEVIKHIEDKYGVLPERLWSKYPDDAVFRHADNKKWFGLIMTVPADKLGLEGCQPVDILNVKCDTLLIASYREKKGFCPAYHMNKTHWLSIILDGSSDENDIKALLALSWDLTANKKK